MRVITGSARGRRLISPEGFDVRPTTDKVKESIFNIIQFNIPGASCLDLFAGSGQLGIEAISRGAEKVTFVDSSRKSFETVKANVDMCRFADKSVLKLSDSFSFLMSCSDKFDIVFLDPPYHKDLCVKALDNLDHVLSSDAVVICETQNDEELPEKAGRLYCDKIYAYSSIKLSVYRLSDDIGV